MKILDLISKEEDKEKIKGLLNQIGELTKDKEGRRRFLHDREIEEKIRINDKKIKLALKKEKRNWKEKIKEIMLNR